MHRIAPLVLAIVVLYGPTITAAQVQSGSTGGTIGKQDKSASGGEEAPPPRQSGAPKSRQSTLRETPSGGSVSGRWRWTADCPSGHWHGEFAVSETSGGQFTGEYAGTTFGDDGTITDGRVNGGSVSFTRHAALGITQHWIGRLTSGHIAGSLSGNESCQWQASRT
ncbi:MAG: hypothetical protein ACLPKB_09185 [Xanthobacteraceae bacterium]